MSDELHNSSPDSQAEIEGLQARRDELLNLREVMTDKLKVRPNDFGIRTWLGLTIVGLLIGWIRTRDIWLILGYALAFWIAGMFFSIFVLDSAEVQSRIAIVLHKLGERRISKWLYRRALSIR
jgi:hypothetical protein